MATAASAPGGDEPRKPTSGGLPVPRSKRGLKGFYNDVVREMKKVSWPTRQETNRLTTVVIAVCGLVVLILSGLSYAFDTLIRLITRGTI